jgi:hypothetical protein
VQEPGIDPICRLVQPGPFGGLLHGGLVEPVPGQHQRHAWDGDTDGGFVEPDLVAALSAEASVGDQQQPCSCTDRWLSGTMPALVQLDAGAQCVARHRVLTTDPEGGLLALSVGRGFL